MEESYVAPVGDMLVGAVNPETLGNVRPKSPVAASYVAVDGVCAVLPTPVIPIEELYAQSVTLGYAWVV